MALIIKRKKPQGEIDATQPVAPKAEAPPQEETKPTEPVAAEQPEPFVEPEPEPEPEEQDDGTPTPDNHMLLALECFAKGKRPERTLMLIRDSTGETFEVLSYSLTQRRVSLRTFEGVVLNPLVGDREARLYSPFWR